jgi:hypothetical protein
MPDQAEQSAPDTNQETGTREPSSATDNRQSLGGDALQKGIAQAFEPALAALRESRKPADDAHPEQPESEQPGSPEPAPKAKRATSRRRQTQRTDPQTDREGNSTMTAETDQKDEGQNEQDTEQEDSTAEAPDRQSGSSSSTNPPAKRDTATPARRGSSSGAQANPRNAARLGLLHMAREWREKGSIYQALHAYEEILGRYPGTGVAAAATEELLEMARKLEAEGQFRAALEIFHKLEEYGVDQ